MRLEIPLRDLDTYLEFLVESREHLDCVEQKVLALSRDGDLEQVTVLFRALHTIKGIAGFLSLTDIQHLSHRLESVFDAIRQGRLALSEDFLGIALACLDHLNSLIEKLEKGLDARVQAPDGQWHVQVEDVDYQHAFQALGAFLQPKDDGAASESETPDELNTPGMKLTFVKESEDLLEASEQSLLMLAKCPDDLDAVSQVLRNVHSFKGNCGYFGFTDLEQASHRLETAMDDIRARKCAMPMAHLNLALECIDRFKSALADIRMHKEGRITDLRLLLARLENLLNPDAGAAVQPIGEILVAQKHATPEAIAYALTLQSRPLGEILVQEGLVSAKAIESALDVQRGKVEAPLAGTQLKSGAARASGASGSPGEAPAKSVTRETKRDIRVDLGKLDHLMDLVGELVISTGMIINHPVLKTTAAADLEKVAHQLKGVVADLQSVALGVRMVPIEGTFRKMTRLVHDLSSKIGKQVELDFRGEATEVDKTVTDLITDPLVHMIRNSVDHGLEIPEIRVRSGKRPVGRLTLEACQEGGDILITLTDDGQGLNRERILSKAIEKGLAGPEAANLSDAEVFNFIFQPGFSTAEAVTSTSGRGVGMDVVKANIDKLGGTIRIESQRGQGTRITLRIPLTLSIIDGMLVRSGDSLFILPLIAVRESLAPQAHQVFTQGEGAEMLLLRGKTYPIVRLGRRYGLSSGCEKLTDGLLVHMEVSGTAFCLAVDDLLGQRQVVVKALPDVTSGVMGIGSCSILDNGEIALIIDVNGLLKA